MGKERRLHARYKLWLPARLERESVDELGFAVGHDFSQSGSLMVTSTKLSPGDKIILHVRIPPDADEERTINAHVLRCDENTADPNGLWPYRIAVEFEDADPELERLLRDQTVVLEGLKGTGEQACR